MKSQISHLNKLKKLLKYLLFSFIIFISLNYIPQNKLNLNENLMIISILSVTYVILDIISPSINIK